jgi:arylsulfatase A-like enzyme
MTGRVENCNDNNCGRVTIETLPEKLKTTLGLQKKEIAIFASWYEIEYAAEHIQDSVFTNTANTPVFDPDTKVADPIMADLNFKQDKDHYPDDDITRFDKYTIAQAMHYFETYLPRFLWISLDDADEAAHGKNRNAYIAALTMYDNFIDSLFTKLKELNIDQETMVIVTTDHGRGTGLRWTDHGPHDPASNVTWAFVMNGDLVPVSHHNNVTNYSTLSIRPTIESQLTV